MKITAECSFAPMLEKFSEGEELTDYIGTMKLTVHQKLPRTQSIEKYVQHNLSVTHCLIQTSA